MENPVESSPRPMRVLMVCTANICRSPMAEGLLRTVVASSGLPVQVASAGVEAIAGPAAPAAIAAMADRGIDIAGHRSHQIAPVDIAAADLVLTMARSHAVEVVGAVPEAFGRTFTLPEFVRRAAAVGPADDVALSAWLPLVHAGRDRWSLLRGPADDEVDDPYGRSRRAFVRCADRLTALVAAVDELLPTVAVGAASSAPPGRLHGHEG